MSLSLDRPVPVVSFSKYPPQGVPIGSHAFVLKMTPEALDELAAQLATQQVGALQNPNALNGRSNDKKKKDDKPVMQLVVGESGQQQFLIGGQVFKVEAINEQSTCEIYARHQSPTVDLDQPPNDPSSASAGPLQMVATVNGRLHVKKEYGAKTQQVIGERTSKTNKETQSRSAIIIDSATMPTNGTIKGPPRSLPNKPPVASPVPSSSSNPRAVQTAPGVFTPPKSDGSPSSSTSVIRGQKHAVPAAFNTLDLTIPTDWTGPIPVAIRVIHTVVLSPKFESEVLRDKDMGVTDAAEQKEALRACGILCDRQADSTLRLKDEAYYYLRPFLWVHYSPTARSDVSKNMRIALRKLGYDDNDEVWEFLRRGNGWVDPWKSTPEGMNYYREKEQRKTATYTTSGSGVASASTPTSKEDREKLRAEALANPAPMLTSSIKPGFFASNSTSTAKGKKGAKDKESKEPKEPKEPKAKKDKTTKAASKKANASESSSRSHDTLPPSTATNNNRGQSSKPSSKSNRDSIEPPATTSKRYNGPGSAQGKIAAVKRLQKEKEEGRASTVSTPSRSPNPHSLPVGPNSASNSVAGTPTRKRKADDDDYNTESVKKRKLAPVAAPTTASTPTAGIPSTSRHASGSTPTLASTSSTQTKKRKSDNIEPVPTAATTTSNKTRKMDNTQPKLNPTPPLANPSHPPKIAPAPLPELRPLAPAPTKSKGSGTRDSNRKNKAAWDYSSDEGTSSAPSKGKPKFGRLGLVPHHVAPPTTYKGFQAVKLQKASELQMINGIILGEEAKLDNARPGDDASTLMSLPELHSLMKKMKGLKAELGELDVELKRLEASQASASSFSNSSGPSTSTSLSSGSTSTATSTSLFGWQPSMFP